MFLENDHVPSFYHNRWFERCACFFSRMGFILPSFLLYSSFLSRDLRIESFHLNRIISLIYVIYKSSIFILFGYISHRFTMRGGSVLVVVFRYKFWKVTRGTRRAFSTMVR